jgi:hypothetical protein
METTTTGFGVRFIPHVVGRTSEIGPVENANVGSSTYAWVGLRARLHALPGRGFIQAGMGRTDGWTGGLDPGSSAHVVGRTALPLPGLRGACAFRFIHARVGRTRMALRARSFDSGSSTHAWVVRAWSAHVLSDLALHELLFLGRERPPLEVPEREPDALQPDLGRLALGRVDGFLDGLEDGLVLGRDRCGLLAPQEASKPTKNARACVAECSSASCQAVRAPTAIEFPTPTTTRTCGHGAQSIRLERAPRGPP